MSKGPIFPELEATVRAAADGRLGVDLRFNDPDSDTEVLPAHGNVPLDLRKLEAQLLDPAAYGRTLAAALFDEPEVRGLWTRVKIAVESRGRQLRLRLRLDPSAASLHGIRWELMRDPESGAELATSERVLLSRFMASRDWRPVKLRPRRDLHALVAVAAPSDLDRFRLAEIDASVESARARQALGGSPETGSQELAADVLGETSPLSLDALVNGLRGGVDILYLICHGALSRTRQEPVLYLQNPDGTTAPTRGAELAARIAELAEPPRLVVLASCESAKAETTDDSAAQAAQAALAPRLAESGVSAVVAMQGKISFETVQRAMPIFFRELLRDGQVDRALAVARGVVRDRPDAWMPVLLTRLKSGRIWYVPGFAGQGDDFERWRSLCHHVRLGKCIPIVGPDLSEGLLGTSAERAERLAEAHGFPMAHHERTDLAKVAQYLGVDQNRDYAQSEILKLLRAQALERGKAAKGTMREADGAPEAQRLDELPLPQLLDSLAERRRQSPDDPYRILADLPSTIYLSASQETLLFKGLRAAGREPELLACDWRPTAFSHPQEPPYSGVPSVERPALYHVFGVFGRPGSLVLTEDDFFDYLIANSTYKLMPTVVRGSLTESSLLFLGLPLGDLTFRVLFRMIMTLEGCADLKRYSHVGVQIDPDAHSLADAERARRYLQRYFGTDRGAGHGRSEPEIELFWGSAADFLVTLRDKLEATKGETEALRMAKEDDGGWF